MSLKFIKHFVYLGVSYDVFYDTGDNSGVVNTSGGTALTNVPLPNAGDSANEGDLITEICSDNPNTTKISAFASTVSPFATFSLEADSADCPVPVPGSCDVAINSIAATDESDTGANDGTATINATTTAGGLQYSLDGSVYVSTNRFTNLAPGNYTAYVKDANECGVVQAFSILAFVNPVQSFTDDLPTVNIPAGNISKWNAAFNPIVIFFQRKDFKVILISRINDNQIRVELDTKLQLYQYQLAINDAIYFKTDKYEFYGKASAYTEAGDHGILTVTEPYTEDDTSLGYININGIKPGYYIECKIKYGIDPVHPKYINSLYSQNNKGQTRADLAPFLQTLLDFKDNYDYVAASYTDLSAGASYTVQFRETWTGGNGAWFSAPYPLYVTRAAMQLGEKNNGNLAAYVPFRAVSSINDKAKFLTDFKEPVYWQGKPFELSFIYSEDLINEQLFLELVPDCGETQYGFLLNADAGHVLDTDTGRFIISRSIIDSIPVLQALGVNRLLVPDSFDCCASKIVANIYYLVDDVKTYVMQQLTIRTICKCDEPYTYIKWLNSRGAWDYYYFGFNQTLNASITNDQSVKRFVMNWETDDTIEDVVSKSSIRSLVVGADGVTDDDANALQWARKSVKAMMLTGTNPVKWQTVIIKEGTSDMMQTRKHRSNIKLELLLVSDNIQNA